MMPWDSDILYNSSVKEFKENMDSIKGISICLHVVAEYSVQVGRLESFEWAIDWVVHPILGVIKLSSSDFASLRHKNLILPWSRDILLGERINE